MDKPLVKECVLARAGSQVFEKLGVTNWGIEVVIIGQWN